MTEEGPIGPNLFPWANEESACSAFASPREPNDSCLGYTAFVLPADCVAFAIDRKEHRNFTLYTCHAMAWGKHNVHTVAFMQASSTECRRLWSAGQA